MGAGEVVCMELFCVSVFPSPRDNSAGIVEVGGIEESVEASSGGGKDGDVPWLRRQVS